MKKEEPCCGGKMCCCGKHSFAKKIMMTLLGVLLVYVIFLTGTLIRNNIKKFVYIGKADRMERTVVITGYGKVMGKNDIAVTTIGYSNTNKDVSAAQAENKTVMDKVAADLKKLGVADNDLQSDYTIYPDYNYTQDKGQELKGYKVTNSVTVKIRDLSKVSEILSLAGKYGATQVSGLSFTVDEPENLKTQARAKAVADAKLKAGKLAASLGVVLGEVVSYSEYEGMSDYYSKSAYMGAEGGGGPAIISSGSQDVIVNVSVTYELR